METVDEDQTLVFVPDNEQVWAPGRVLSRDGSRIEFEAEDGKRRVLDLETLGKTLKQQQQQLRPGQADTSLFMGCLPLQNPNTHRGVEDMASLPFLNEPAILYNLRHRHRSKNVYTYTAEIVLAVNPFQWMDHLYSEEAQKEYLIYERASLPPHLFAVSAAAHNRLKEEGVDQAILVSGESGAGKTESVKLLLKHLAFMSASDDEATVRRIVSVNPIMEAFGNAKTIRNDNSSRFGKYIELTFTGNTLRLAGSKMKTYLLEKSRVVSQSIGERSFHCFYGLLQGASPYMKQRLQLGGAGGAREAREGKVTDWIYLSGGGEGAASIDSVDDGQNHSDVLSGLEVMGFSADDQHCLFEALAAILHLGEIRFQATVDEQTQEECTRVELQQVQGQGQSAGLLAAAALLGCDPETMGKVCTRRTMVTQGESLEIRLKVHDAEESRDALAKDLYSRLFDWLVTRLNQVMAASEVAQGSAGGGGGEGGSSIRRMVSLLDIFGFECFEVNRFEQFCINYANERLQQKFIHDVFKAVQSEYNDEGILWSTVDFRDNAAVLDLIDARMGIISVLNEECMRPKGSDEALCSKLLTAHGQNQGHDQGRLRKPKRGAKDQFEVLHYAGPVCYSTTGFLARNRDTLQEDLRNLLESAGQNLVRHLFRTPATEAKGRTFSQEKERLASAAGKGSKSRRRGSLVADTVATKFRAQLNTLLESIEATQVQYVRCIKPNVLASPDVFDLRLVTAQLRYAGVLEAIRISREAYPNRLAHSDMLFRFGPLSSATLRDISRRRRPASEAGTSTQGESLTLRGLEQRPELQQVLGALPFFDRRFIRGLLEGDDNEFTVKDACMIVVAILLETMDLDVKQSSQTLPFQVGKSKVYFSSGVFETLEERRASAVRLYSLRVQSHMRRYLEARKLKFVRGAAIRIQSLVRGTKACRAWTVARHGVVQLQAACRRRCAARAVQQLIAHRSATVLQALVRRWRQRGRFQAVRRKVVLLQSLGRVLNAKRRALIIQQRRNMEMRIAELEESLAATSEELEVKERQLESSEARAEQLSRDLDRTTRDQAEAEDARAVQRVSQEQREALVTQRLRGLVATLSSRSTSSCGSSGLANGATADVEWWDLSKTGKSSMGATAGKAQANDDEDEESLLQALGQLEMLLEPLGDRLGALKGALGEARAQRDSAQGELQARRTMLRRLNRYTGQATDKFGAFASRLDEVDIALAVQPKNATDADAAAGGSGGSAANRRPQGALEESRDLLILHPDGSAIWECSVAPRTAQDVYLALSVSMVSSQVVVESIPSTEAEDAEPHSSRDAVNPEQPLQVGDRVLEINGSAVLGLSLQEAQSLLAEACTAAAGALVSVVVTSDPSPGLHDNWILNSARPPGVFGLVPCLG